MHTANYIEEHRLRLIRSEELVKSSKKRKTNLVLIYALLAVSGMEYFYHSQNYLLVGFIIAVIGFRSFGLKLEKSWWLIAFLFCIIETFQYAQFGGFNIRTFSGTYIRLFFAYAVVQLSQNEFPRYYVKILYFLSVCSLFFYVGSFLPGAESFYLNTLANLVPNPWADTEGFYQGKPNIVIFCFEQTLFQHARNSGPFWEPGAFGIFLMIGLVFNHLKEKKLLSKTNLVFMICIITTFSTAAYITLFIFLVYINFNKIRTNILYWIMFIGVIAGSAVLYEKIPFLKQKIDNNILMADETTSSRFGSALADYNTFKESPFIGFGRAGAKTGFKSEKSFDVEDHRNNGVFNLLVTYGVILSAYYFYRIYRSFKNIGAAHGLPNYFAGFSFVIMMLSGFSQGIFMLPFFYSFLFLPEVYKIKK